MESSSNQSPPAQITLFDVGDPHLPVLPYGMTSGWSGSDASRERAERADASGLTGENQRRLYRMLKNAQHQGLTWAEAADIAGWHHGTASGALSALHKARIISRLAERRMGSSVYVLPEFVGDRETRGYEPNLSAKLLRQILEELEADLEQGHLSLALSRVRATRQALQ